MTLGNFKYAVAFCMLSFPAMGQEGSMLPWMMPCGDTAEMDANLMERGERPKIEGNQIRIENGKPVESGMVVQMWHDPKTNEWTVTAALPDGRTCIAFAGVRARSAAPKTITPPRTPEQKS